MAASNTRFTQNSLGQSKIPLTVITVSTAIAARIHHAPRQRCGAWPLASSGWSQPIF